MREVSGKTQVIAVALVTALCMLGDSMLYVVLPIYWEEAGLSSLWEVGVLLSVNRLVRVPLGPLVGKWYERTGGRTGLFLAVGLAFVTTFAYGFQGFWLWFIARCLWGVAWTFLRLGAYSLIVTVAEEHNRGQFMGLYNGLYRLGSLGGMLGGALLASVYGMFFAAAVLATLSLFALILLFLYVRPIFTNQSTQAVQRLEERSLWKQKRVLATLVTALVVTMVYQGMFASTLSRLIELRHPFIAVGGVMLGAAVLASLVQGLRWSWEPWAAPLFGKLSDHYGRKKLFIWTLIAGSILFGLLQASVMVAIWFAILLGIQVTATIVTTVVDTLAADEAAKQTNSTALMTAYSVITDIGAALGPLAAFWMDGSVGLDVMYIIIAIALLAIAFAWAGEKRWVKMSSAP
ncbi:MFS transporter [Brevibacillus sp. SIMBA_040]|uniref:MFS transporter n=1 Tax=unclassified Brevibacillus TaxID=2684853 RepID=UPI00397D1B9C